MLRRLVALAAGTGLFLLIIRAAEDDVATVEYAACRNISAPHHVHVGDKSLYLPSNGPSLKWGRVYELTYVKNDGRVTAARDLREASCNG